MKIHSCRLNIEALSKNLGLKFLLSYVLVKVDLRTVVRGKILLKFCEVLSLQSYTT